LRSLVPYALSVCFVAVPAAAQEAKSVYTSMKSKQCKTEKTRDEDSAAWTCPGIDGLVVAGYEGDARQSISVGRSRALARKEPAADTFFGPPNIANDTIEWRIPPGTDKPFAIIQRWTLIPSEDPRRSILVVTRLPPGPVCHVAYVDVAKNGAEANVIARKGADELAKTFDCKTAPQILGQRGGEIAVSRNSP
jgi:hypothetical protein